MECRAACRSEYGAQGDGQGRRPKCSQCVKLRKKKQPSNASRGQKWEDITGATLIASGGAVFSDVRPPSSICARGAAVGLPQVRPGGASTRPKNVRMQRGSRLTGMRGPIEWRHDISSRFRNAGCRTCGRDDGPFEQLHQSFFPEVEGGPGHDYVPAATRGA